MLDKIALLSRCLLKRSTNFNYLQHSKNLLNVTKISQPVFLNIQMRNLSLTSQRNDLNEFFENEKFRGELKVKVGRSWKTDELRLKNNQDLHKLWFVLLKERNMLMTMEQAYKDEFKSMPNPERLDKVEESMENLEEVVRERNRAYHQLEVGVTGERDRYHRLDALGRLVVYKPTEHRIPVQLNRKWRNKMNFRYHTNFGPAVVRFLRLWREREHHRENHKKWVEMRTAAKIVRRFGEETDLEGLKEQFPLVNVNLLQRWRRCWKTEFTQSK